MRGASRTFILHEPLHYEGGTVPIGFVTDGASIPRSLWWAFSPTGRAFGAAIIHDYHYQHSTGTRKHVDQYFRFLLKQLNFGLFLRNGFYRAVRIGAGATWRAYRL